MIQYCFTRHYTFRYSSSRVVGCALYRFHKGLWEVEGFAASLVLDIISIAGFLEESGATKEPETDGDEY